MVGLLSCDIWSVRLSQLYLRFFFRTLDCEMAEWTKCSAYPSLYSMAVKKNFPALCIQHDQANSNPPTNRKVPQKKLGILMKMFETTFFLKGEALFQTHENLEHLAMMERVLGPLPQHMMNRVDRHAEKYFKRGIRLDWPEGAASRESIRAVWKLERLQNLVMQHVDHSAGDLIDLLQGLLRYDPAERLKAREALQHPFFNRDHRRIGRSY